MVLSISCCIVVSIGSVSILLKCRLYNPNYIENQWWDDNVNTILDTKNPMSSSLFAMREKYAADFVVVVLNNNGACGSNYGGGYIVVNQDCMTGYYSMAHEVGHAMVSIGRKTKTIVFFLFSQLFFI